MNTQEKLERIKARCQELLAIAEKRTPGEWEWGFHGATGFHRIKQRDGEIDVVATDLGCSQYGQREIDATFIAFCAGPAEAGWRATIAAIDGLLLIATEGQEPERGSACFDLGKILAAWPDEIL